MTHCRGCGAEFTRDGPTRHHALGLCDTCYGRARPRKTVFQERGRWRDATWGRGRCPCCRRAPLALDAAGMLVWHVPVLGAGGRVECPGTGMLPVLLA